jgi:hypothetical protein
LNLINSKTNSKTMENQNAPVMSVKDWAITIFITSIPFVGIIMLFVWAFSSGNNPNK